MTAKRPDVFYLYLSSEDSKDIYSRNTPQDFILQLPERIKFIGEWSVALAEADYPNKFNGKTPDFLWFEVDLCEASIIGDRKASVLRRLASTQRRNQTPEAFYPMFYVPLRNYDFDQVQVYIKDPSGSTVSFAGGLSYCTLQFARRW